MKKNCKKVCRIKFLLYLCTRNQKGKTLLKAKVLGALVQLVRIRACHARGQGFESPTHRTKEDNLLIVFFFVYIRIARVSDYIGNMSQALLQCVQAPKELHLQHIALRLPSPCLKSFNRWRLKLRRGVTSSDIRAPRLS